ncbi:MAG: hypothetical protein ACJ74W_04680 [Pyrinomonadaceae bacterium]
MAATVSFTNALRDEYQNLFGQCQVRPNQLALVDNLAAKIEANKARYQQVGGPLNIPWYFIGIVHNMECSLNFSQHLHNGDPLTAFTKQVPAGRPKVGHGPPFTWEESAADALSMRNLQSPAGWSLPATLYKLERYNGFGYRTRNTGINTPYLWSFSNLYAKGKFVKDGVFNANAVSQQCGAAVLLRRMAETGKIVFGTDGEPLLGEAGAPPDLSQFAPLVRFAPNEISENARALQNALNKFPGIFLLADGRAGQNTSDAFKRITGHFLLGDPRA